MVKFDLNESRCEPVLPAEPEPQSQLKHTETQTERGLQREEQFNPQSVPSSEAHTQIEDVLQLQPQPKTQSDSLHEQIKQINHVAGEAVKIETIRGRLGASVTYLEELLKIGDVLKDVSRLFQTRPPTDHKYSRRSTRSLAFL